MLAPTLAGPAGAKDTHQPYVGAAEIEIDPSQVQPYGAAVKQQIEAAVRLEPGVLALYAVADKDNPAQFPRAMAASRTSREDRLCRLLPQS